MRGGIILATAAVLACAGCLGNEGKLEIRSASNGLKAGREPVPFRIAEARGHLAIGNVALALEAFRKAAREDPASVEALAGIAQCYDQMGRFDLSRRHYEMALAVAPRDPRLLALLASSLDAQGLRSEAASVRQELAALAVAPAEVAASLQVEIAAAAPAPPEVASPVGKSVTIALPPPRPASPAKAEPVAQTAMIVAPVGKSVTIALPAPRLAPPARQPRLERLSLTEVALVTGDGPRWKRPDTLPLRTAARTAPAPVIEVRLLNAARIDKLAARTRAYLGRFGWREIGVGDAAAVRRRSLIVYPEGAKAAASRLSTRLGFAMAPRNDVRQLTVLLGRDAAAHPALKPKG